jgi:hypothetical protein
VKKGSGVENEQETERYETCLETLRWRGMRSGSLRLEVSSMSDVCSVLIIHRPYV